MDSSNIEHRFDSEGIDCMIKILQLQQEKHHHDLVEQQEKNETLTNNLKKSLFQLTVMVICNLILVEREATPPLIERNYLVCHGHNLWTILLTFGEINNTIDKIANAFNETRQEWREKFKFTQDEIVSNFQKIVQKQNATIDTELQHKISLKNYLT